MKIRRVREIEQPEIGDSTALGFDRGLVRQKAPSILQTDKKTGWDEQNFQPGVKQEIKNKFGKLRVGMREAN